MCFCYTNISTSDISAHQKVVAAAIETTTVETRIRISISTTVAAAAGTRNDPEMIAVMVIAVQRNHGNDLYSFIRFDTIHMVDAFN